MTGTEKILADIDELVRNYYMLKHQPSEAVKGNTLSMPAYDHREWIRAIRTILGGWISQGPNVMEFEKSFAEYCECHAGIAVNSGSSANLLALLALKDLYQLKDGDEVIVPAATFSTVAMPIIQVGLVPVYVDVSLETLNLDPDAVLSAISKRTKILMPVHTLGYPANMSSLMEIAAKYKLRVLEDCCEAHGSSIHGKKVGSFGDIGTYSFFVAHNITTGEGGMIVTKNPDVEKLCRSMREFGRINQQNLKGSGRFYSDDVLTDYDKRYVFERLGYNVRMTDIAAALGLEQLKKLESLNENRRANAALLKKFLEGFSEFFDLPHEEVGYRHTYYTFPIILKEQFPFSRREFVEHLESHGIETRPLFAGCLPDQPGFRNAPGKIAGILENSRYLRDRLIFVGIHPGLNEQNMKYMADVISSFIYVKR